MGSVWDGRKTIVGIKSKRDSNIALDGYRDDFQLAQAFNDFLQGLIHMILRMFFVSRTIIELVIDLSRLKNRVLLKCLNIQKLGKAQALIILKVSCFSPVQSNWDLFVIIFIKCPLFNRRCQDYGNPLQSSQ